MLWRIDQPEVLEHEAALLGGEAGQLVPGRVAELRARARGARREHARQMDAVADGGAADPLFLLVRLGAREGAARVEQPAVQPALALDRLAVESASLELAGQLARLLGEGPRGGALPAPAARASPPSGAPRSRARARAGARRARAGRRPRGCDAPPLRSPPRPKPGATAWRRRPPRAPAPPRPAAAAGRAPRSPTGPDRARSEERRVGKECRCRGSGYH